MDILDIPDDLDVWTFDTVLDIVRHHDFEPGRFDFKEWLNVPKEELRNAANGAREEHLRSIQRTVCSMANSAAGFIIFGVVDGKAKKCDTRDELIVGIPASGELRKEFGDKLADLQPEVHFEMRARAIPLPDDPSRVILPVSIPHSPLRPHMIRPLGAFYRRGDNGTAVKMDYYEVREQMLNSEERLRKLNLFRLQLAQYKQVRELLVGRNVNVGQALLRFDTSAYLPLLADLCVLIPPNDKALQELLDLPTHMAQINRHLDQANQLYFIGQQVSPLAVQGILEQLQRFVDDWEVCQQHLERLFGPMGAPI